MQLPQKTNRQRDYERHLKWWESSMILIDMSYEALEEGEVRLKRSRALVTQLGVK